MSNRNSDAPPSASSLAAPSSLAATRDGAARNAGLFRERAQAVADRTRRIVEEDRRLLDACRRAVEETRRLVAALPVGAPPVGQPMAVPTPAPAGPDGPASAPPPRRCSKLAHKNRWLISVDVVAALRRAGVACDIHLPALDGDDPTGRRH